VVIEDKLMKWQVGDTERITYTIDDDCIRRFQSAVDFSPSNLDDEATMRAIFGKRVVHGPIAASLISSLLGTLLPGPGSILLEQTFKYVAPVVVDDVLTASATITAIRADKPVVTLNTRAMNQSGQTVIEGQAKVLFRELNDWKERRGV
jgi:3-hydroxybutyryl-CoA dehydratase